MKKNKSKRIGIMGGSFDPPHMGHLIFAEQVRQQLKLDKFYFIPCAESPHSYKDVRVSAEHRYNMLKLAIGSNRRYGVSDIEMKRGGVSYTIDTLNYFLSKNPGCELYLLIGSDLYNTFDTWKNYKEILKKAQVTVILRGKKKFKKKKGFSFIVMPEIDLSSTYIRDEIFSGRSIKYLVPEEVEKYIKKNKFYRQ